MSSSQEIENKELFVAHLNKSIQNSIFYTCILILTFNMLTNVLNILICLRAKIRKSIMGFYNHLISASNLASLVVGFVRFFPESIGRADVILASTFSCALGKYLTYTIVTLPPWLHVMASLDRTLSILYPKRFECFIRNKCFLSWSILVFIVTEMIIYVPFTFFYLENTNQTIRCKASQRVFFVAMLELALLRTLAPLLLQALLSGLLIWKLFRTRRNAKTRRLKREYHFAFVILVLNVCFFVTELPIMIVNMVFAVRREAPTMPITPATSMYWASVNVARHFAQLFATYMYGSIFFVNLFFNKIFRKEIKHMLRNCKRTSVNSRESSLSRKRSSF